MDGTFIWMTLRIRRNRSLVRALPPMVVWILLLLDVRLRAFVLFWATLGLVERHVALMVVLTSLTFTTHMKLIGTNWRLMLTRLISVGAFATLALELRSLWTWLTWPSINRWWLLRRWRVTYFGLLISLLVVTSLRLTYSPFGRLLRRTRRRLECLLGRKKLVLRLLLLLVVGMVIRLKVLLRWMVTLLLAFIRMARPLMRPLLGWMVCLALRNKVRNRLGPWKMVHFVASCRTKMFGLGSLVLRDMILTIFWTRWTRAALALTIMVWRVVE